MTTERESGQDNILIYGESDFVGWLENHNWPRVSHDLIKTYEKSKDKKKGMKGDRFVHAEMRRVRAQPPNMLPIVPSRQDSAAYIVNSPLLPLVVKSSLGWTYSDYLLRDFDLGSLAFSLKFENF